MDMPEHYQAPQLAGIALDTKQKILTEVECQLNLGMEGLPPKSSCLLEIKPTNLYGASNAAQQIWLNAIRVAYTVGEEVVRRTKG